MWTGMLGLEKDVKDDKKISKRQGYGQSLPVVTGGPCNIFM